MLDFIAEVDLCRRAARIGDLVRERFLKLQERFSLIGDVRGLGAMMGLELVLDRKTKQPAIDQAKALVKYAYENGLVLLNCGKFSNVIRTLMPLVITDDQLEEGLTIIEKGLRQLPNNE